MRLVNGHRLIRCSTCGGSANVPVGSMVTACPACEGQSGTPGYVTEAAIRADERKRIAKLAREAHDLKTWPPFFEAVADGRKTFEIRRDDRAYTVGDALRLREWRPETGTYTGRECFRRITYIVRDAEMFGLMDGFAILGLDTDTAHDSAIEAAAVVVETDADKHPSFIRSILRKRATRVRGLKRGGA